MIGRILVLTALLAWAGCASASGVITGPSAPAPDTGTVAPDVEYRSMQGGQASFNKVRKPVTIVVFVTPPGAACCWLDPEVFNLADQFWDLPVTVAQFSLPTSQCPHGAGCTEGCHIREGSVMSLCDAHRLAWDAYGRPTPGTLILLGPDNRIVMTGPLGNPSAVVNEAKRLGRMEKERLRGPGGERLGIY
jgi:putative hemolysin